MKDKVLDVIENASSIYDIFKNEIIEDIYKCSPVDKQLIILKVKDKLTTFGKEYIKIFDKMLSDYEKVAASNKFNHICDVKSLHIDEKFGYYINSLNTGEFILARSGIYSSGNTLICPTPVVPFYLYEKNMDNVEKVRILFLKNEKWQILDIDRFTISNQNKIIDLSNHGIGVNSGNSSQMVKYFNTIFDMNVDNINIRKSVAKLGWVDDNTGFIPYNSSDYDFVLSVNDKGLDGAKQTYEAICEKGDYDTWFDCMQRMRTNIPTRLAFGSSAISPLLSILGAPCFVTMLYGQTGTGKTLSCRCAMSMWGDPNVLSMRADSTTTSIVRKCLFFNNLPLFVDEFQLLTREDSIQEFLMSVTEGQQRTRATMDSSNNFTSSATWRNCTLITGERQCATSSLGGGAINRIIELRIDDMVANEMDLQEIYYKIDNNYGFLGQKLIDLYTNEEFLKKIKVRFNEIQNEWRNKLNTMSKQLIAISCLVLGDEILRENFFHDEKAIDVSDIEQYVATQEEISYPERVYKEVCDIIIANYQRFARDTAAPYRSDISGEMWGSVSTQDNDIFYVIPAILTRELAKSKMSIDKTTKEYWRVKGYIDCSYKKDGTFDRYTKKERVNGRDIHCYVISINSDNLFNKKVENEMEDDLK